ncbi:hypothetical protein GQX73_g5203 [Xylaria multiplex]|uniref:mitogen-activated protein kinase n=1 Tax=Xylaria multiplex TaxID=323545 RepID=A0A7C8INP5_9PEZI|nr:hypothetical protein GQX73_g5203 [Xylaria multiplex]
MPRPHPHPLAVFSLKPTNQRAYDVLAHPNNEHLVSRLKSGELVLDVGHVSSLSGNSSTLATMGRDADITIPGASISKIHCSFEIDPTTNIVMFWDRSHNQSCQVFGEIATPFGYTRARKVVVNDEINTEIGIGGEKRNLISFQLQWHCKPSGTMEKVKDRQLGTLEQHQRLARTIDESATMASTQIQTRIHTIGDQSRIRYHPLNEPLGRGEFGSVEKVIDIDTGRLMALKSLTRPVGSAERAKFLALVKSEVENLSRLNHPHIVDYITFECLDDINFHIFTGLKQGNLESLIENVRDSRINSQVAKAVLDQMLQALDFLSTQNVIHRDVKPRNILYTGNSGDFSFQLSDFGLSSSTLIKNTISGSPIFMAPEIMEGGSQTHKVDVWSLFVTTLWTLDTDDFRQRSRECENYEDVRTMVLSRVLRVFEIEEMARVNPNERASAAQMLVKHFNGYGLSTPLSQVLVHDNSQACTSAETVPALTRKFSSQLKRKGLWRRAILQDRFRVGKGLCINSKTTLIDHLAATRKRVGRQIQGGANLRSFLG